MLDCGCSNSWVPAVRTDMNGFRIGLTVAALAAHPAMGAESATKLKCASAQGIKTEVERELVPGNTYNVNVVFVGKAPPAQEIDRILRDCLAAAARQDGSKDILGSPWLRKKAGDRHNNDELLHPYDGLQYLGYEARSGAIAIRGSGEVAPVPREESRR
jgi:hypothetical protein